ncbi:hypothetical protein Q7P37_008266 [Cladosporium fusiforme]
MTSASTSAQELATFAASGHDHHEEQPEQDFQALAPADSGKDAYLFLAACVGLEALFGVFQVYYDQHEPFASQGGSASIGTTESGIMYFAAPFAALAVQRWPQYRRRASCCGLAVMIAGLVAASFCNSVNALIATQGVMYALGGLVAYFPGMSMIPEWFIQRRGLAFGIMWAGTGLAGTVLPFLLQWVLDTHGYRTALRLYAFTLFVLASPCLYFIRPRLPITNASSWRPVEISFLKHCQFWIFQSGNILQSLGFFLPTLYIPSFASSIGLPSFAGPLALALFNVAFTFGAVFIGTLVDRFHVSVAILTCTVGQMISIFVFWGLASSQSMLYIFAMLFGCFGGAFSCTWSGCANAIQRHENNGNVDVSVVVALMAAGKGIGAVISGPLSEKLLTLDTWRGQAGFAYGSGYGLLLVFTGVSATLGATSDGIREWVLPSPTNTWLLPMYKGPTDDRELHRADFRNMTPPGKTIRSSIRADIVKNSGTLITGLESLSPWTTSLPSIMAQIPADVATIRANLAHLANELLDLSKTFEPSDQQLFKPEPEIIAKAKALIATAQTPIDFSFSITSSVVGAAVIRTLVHLKALSAISVTDGATAASIAEAVGAQPSLVERLLRAAVSIGFLSYDPHSHAIKHTHISAAWAGPHSPATDWFSFGYDMGLAPLVLLPDWLQHNNEAYAAEPSGEKGRTYNPLTYRLGAEGVQVFETLAQKPEQLAVFSRVLAAAAGFRPFTGIYPWERLADPDPERPLFVDVGGGYGHAISAILAAHSDLPASGFVLQDLANVLTVAERENKFLSSSVHRQPHDFFTPNPIKGAKVYHIRACLHDWPDEVCVQILRNVTVAMAADSRLLIVEGLLPEDPQLDLGGLMCFQDMLMLCMGGKERTEEGFGRLAAEAGLVIERVWEGEEVGRFGVVECRLGA